MNQHTMSYGLVPPQSTKNHDMHILPITKFELVHDGFLTCGRDGTLVKHFYFDYPEGYPKRIRMQIHSDWISGMVRVNDYTFLTVSHDFSVSLLKLQEFSNNWSSVILGYHDDYVKCIELLPHEDGVRFVTAGLDKKVKFWSLLENSASLLFEYDNSQPHETGAVYALCALSPSHVIIGDNNGELKIISAVTGELLYKLTDSHASNIRLAKVLQGGKTLITASSDGYVNIWDVNALVSGQLQYALLSQWRRDCSVWCVLDGLNENEILLGDSKGRITSIIRKDDYWQQCSEIDLLVNARENSCGILSMVFTDENKDKLWFSYSSDSNLYLLSLKDSTNTLQCVEGGSALVKSSLLTNRRNVITLNTAGEVQKWDIVSCELVDTFGPNDGSFDDLVKSHCTKEILPHWCSVSIKTGKLFVKLNERLNSTEVYGTALKGYEIINGVEVNDDQRYNLGRLAINSILYEFIRYETKIDKLIRSDLATSKKPSSLNLLNMGDDPSINREPSSSNLKKVSLFTKMTGGTSSSVPTRSVSPSSVPSTPFATDMYHFENRTVDQSDLLLMPKPTTATQGFRVCSQSVQSSSRIPSTAPEMGDKANPRNYHTLPWGDTKAFNPVGPPSQDTAGSSLFVLKSLPSTPPPEGNGYLLPYPTACSHLAHENSSRAAETAPGSTPKDIEFMSDYLATIADTYRHQVSTKQSGFKKFGRKAPDSQFVRDEDAPVIKIKKPCLFLVNYLRAGSCGDTVLFSTVIPAPDYDWNFEDIECATESEDMATDDPAKLDHIQRYALFRKLEQNLPYWLAKLLFQEEMTAKSYPKLNFIVTPWSDQSSSEPTVGKEEKCRHYTHNIFRKKAADIHSSLPSIADNCVRLNAPDMIKVKKIKQFVVERFESKTPEMKNRVSASVWLDLLCRDSVLDNEMTLGTIRSLYWKSNNDIVLSYRRKVCDSPDE
ncbi:HHR097Wp [Eremothecium sinecaudum]|uniref:HHR097Wp n=1 Tax=Eremothecium sinecaudum TaxID=45286 RepID=A0A0X8HWN0_9SACH|nr:HHR097Wp [Eremothecium sinecaudum]AMD22866.1 HHR097Wp [Eremothecium sinecaudum]